jgi:hypothetical protein
MMMGTRQPLHAQPGECTEPPLLEILSHAHDEVATCGIGRVTVPTRGWPSAKPSGRREVTALLQARMPGCNRPISGTCSGRIDPWRASR